MAQRIRLALEGQLLQQHRRAQLRPALLEIPLVLTVLEDLAARSQ